MPFVLWYLKHFRVNVREDPQQMVRYRRTLRAAHPQRLKLSAQAVLGYSLFPGLETVKAPVAIAYAASDTLHAGDDVRRIVELLPHGRRSSARRIPICTRHAVAADLRRFISQACRIRP